MLELIIAESLLVFRLKKRKRFALRLTLSLVGCFAFAFLYPIWIYSAIYISVMFFLLFIITLISLYICFDEKILILIFFAIVAYTSQHIAHELYNLVSIVAEFNTVNLYLLMFNGLTLTGRSSCAV